MRCTHEHHHSPSSEGHGHHHHFDDPHAFAHRLDAPERDAWQKPEEVIASLRLPDDAIVAEIGAGTGYFVVRLARHVPNGTVIGLDTQPQMVEYLRQRAADLGLENVDVRVVQQDESLPLSEPLDLLLCVDVYHHIADRVALFSRYAKHLKPHARLVIIDRSVDAAEGPPFAMRLSPETVRAELAEAGYTPVADMPVSLPYQYYLAFTPTATV